MCTPMICVSPVGIHKTLKLQGKHGSYEGQILWVYILKFQLTQNINGRRSEWNYWFETVFGKCLARRQRLQARDTNITTITIQWCVYPNVSQNVCLPLRLWALFWNILLIRNCTSLDRPRIHISLQLLLSDMIYQTISWDTHITEQRSQWCLSLRGGLSV